MRTQNSLSKRSGGFSLIELLVVVVIIGLISAFAVPAAGTMLKGSVVARGVNLLTDETSRARMHALTRNRVVEMRFYLMPDPEIPGETIGNVATWQFRAFQYFEIPAETIGGNSVPIPVGKYIRLPDTVIMSRLTKLSSLIGDAPGAGATLITPTATVDPELPRGVGLNYQYVAFRFLPDGTTNLLATGSPAIPTSQPGGLWFITLHTLEDLPKTKGPSYNPPPNFVTWMLDPVAGISKSLRPGV